MIYRVKQFFWGLIERVKDEDRSFISAYLDKEEQSLFYSLPRYEQTHSLRVAREVLRQSLENEIYDIMLVKAALLHDIGKANSGLNLITKSVFVLFERLFPGLLKRFTNLEAIKAYYYHPEIAVTMLEDQDDYLKYLIKNHHNYGLEEDDKLNILQKADTIS